MQFPDFELDNQIILLSEPDGMDKINIYHTIYTIYIIREQLQ